MFNHKSKLLKYTQHKEMPKYQGKNKLFVKKGPVKTKKESQNGLKCYSLEAQNPKT